MLALSKAFELVGANGDVTAVANITNNMRNAQFNEDEIARIVKALYLSASRQDAREAWLVLDQRKTGTMPRSELEPTLCDIIGHGAAKEISRLLSRLPSHQSAFSFEQTEQMVEANEWIGMVEELAKLGRATAGNIGTFIVHEAAEAFWGATSGVLQASKAWSLLELDVLLAVPPHLLGRAGAVVERMRKAGYSSHEASTAVAALYGGRDTLRVARLWGILDVHRKGSIPVNEFDAVMPLLTDVVTAADVPALRSQMGFIHPESVTLREFEATLRLLVPPDGSPPHLNASEADVDLPSLLGGAEHVSRLRPFQRQRCTRLALRMKNFGYSAEASSVLCKTLFLTRLHDKDLWNIWVMLHPTSTAGKSAESSQPAGSSGEAAGGGGVRKGASVRHGLEVPLPVETVRHLLALLCETAAANEVHRIDALLEKVDANASGDIEFEELATLVRALSPQMARPIELSEVALHPHPLLEQVNAWFDHAAEVDLMRIDAEDLRSAALRAAKLHTIMKRLEDATSHAAGEGGVGGGGGGFGSSGGRTIDRTTVSLIYEVAQDQMTEAELGGVGSGSLERYTTDERSEMLAVLSQALRHAADLLVAHGADSYEGHVAFRTLRTVEELERWDPTRAVDWRGRRAVAAEYGASEDEAASISSRESGADPWRPHKGPRSDADGGETTRVLAATLHGEQRQRQRRRHGEATRGSAAAAARSYQDGGGIRQLSSMMVGQAGRRGSWGASRRVASLDAARDTKAGKVSATDAELAAGSAPMSATARKRIQSIYNRSGEAASEDAPAAAAANAAEQEAQRQAALSRQLQSEADSAVRAAGGDRDRELASVAVEQASKAAAMWRKRRDLLKGDSAAAKITEALRGETSAGLRLAAKQHQASILQKDARATHLARALGAISASRPLRDP